MSVREGVEDLGAVQIERRGTTEGRGARAREIWRLRGYTVLYHGTVLLYRTTGLYYNEGDPAAMGRGRGADSAASPRERAKGYIISGS